MADVFTIDDIFHESHGRWNGKYKLFTKNCGGCKYHKKVSDEDRCYWGIAWKRLAARYNPKKCQFYNLPSPRAKAVCAELKSRADTSSTKKSEWKPDTSKPSYYYDLAEGRWNIE